MKTLTLVSILALAVTTGCAQERDAPGNRAPGKALMGPLQVHLLQGSDGPWHGELREDAYVLSNREDPGAIYYFYTDPTREAEAPMETRVELQANFDGPGSRAGLLFALDPRGPLYYLLVLDGQGRVSVLRRGPQGLEPRSETQLEGGLGRGRDGWHELRLIENGGQVEWRIDGERLGSIGSDELGRGAVGVVAMGTGSFRFRGFETGSDSGSRDSRAHTSQPGTSARGFQTQLVTDQSGSVSLRRPADWRLHPIGQDGQIRLSSPSGETLVVWPFYLRQRLASTGATALLQRMATLVDPGVQCGNAQSISTNAVRCLGKNHNNTTVSGMSWTDGSGFSAGYFYYVSGPEKVLRQNRQLYVEILRSLTIRGSGQMNQSGSAPTRPRLQYQRWQDPVEQAFTMEVPRGWQTRGGLVRRAAVDVTAAVQIISPDGQIRLFIGDANVPTFTIPNQTLAWSGFREGSWYSPGYGVKMMVMRYKPGVNFASEYVQSAFGQHCGGLQIASSRDLPEASQAINRIYQQYNMPGFVQQLTTGEVRFSCQSGGRPQAGYCFAGTEVLQAYGSGIWTVKYLFGYLAPRERASEAETALAHLASSVQMNPAWVRMQQGLTGNVSRITTETGNYISNLINSSYESQQRSQDEMARRYSNYIRGTEDVRDPNTGETYKVESSSNYYWIDARRTIVGTDLDANPDVTRFEQMIRLP